MNSKKFKLLYTWGIMLCTGFLPDLPLLMRLRGWLLSFAMEDCGENFQVSAKACMRNITKLSVGNNVYFAPGMVINSIASIKIGNDVLVGFNSVIVSGNHKFDGNSYRFLKSDGNPIILNDGCWITSNCTVTSGSIILARTVVRPNTVVRREKS